MGLAMATWGSVPAGALPGATSGDVRKAASWSMLARAIWRNIASSAAAQASRWRTFAVSSPLIRRARFSSWSKTSQTQVTVV